MMKGLMKKRTVSFGIILLTGMSILLSGIIMIVSNASGKSDDTTISQAAGSTYSYTFTPNLAEGYSIRPYYTTNFSINASQLKIGCSYYWLSNVDLMFVDASGRVVTNLFTVYPSSFTSVQPRQNASVTVQPQLGLSVGTHTAYLVARGTRNGIVHETSAARFQFTITVDGRPPNPTWGISLSGNYTFAPTDEGYTSNIPAHTATITNTGNQPTGDLTVSLGGTNPNSFILNGIGNSFSVLSIPAGSAKTFTVYPRPDLPNGTHTATVTVSRASNNNNSISSKSLTVSFTVKSYGISLSPAERLFGEFSAGYTIGAAQTQTVTITNTGNQPSGKLTITKAGSSPDSFEISMTEAASITTQNGTRAFTVKPKTGMPAGEHSAIIKVSSDEPKVSSKQITVRFYVSSPSISVTIAGVTIDGSGSYMFPAMNVGYPNPPEAYTAQLTNTGNQVSSALTVSLSGPNAGSFVLTGASIPSIGVMGNASFTIQPKPDLPALSTGAHTAKVTISGTGVSVQFNVGFLVRSYGISLSQKNELKLNDAYKDGPSYFFMPDAQTITVSNTGNQSTGALTATVSTSSFTVSSISPSIITSSGGTATFTIRPKNDLVSGLHTATVTVNGTNVPSQQFDVRFFIRELSISLDQTEGETYIFQGVNQGYGQSDLQPLTVTVTNTGNYATGELAIGIWGANPESFQLSDEIIPSIAVGTSATFTVTPALRLITGSHNACITVYGDYLASQTFDVSFRITSLNMDISDDHRFPETGAGYTTSPRHTVTIKNIGADTIDILYIEIVNDDGSFLQDKLSVENILPGRTAEFDIWPALGLMPSAHFLTILITDHASLAAQFNAIFVVTYSKIELSHSEIQMLPAAEGYTSTASLARTVTVYNRGTAATGLLNITLVEGAVDDFVLSRSTISNIALNGNTTFTITPRLGLERGSYTVVVKVGNDNVDERYVTVNLFVGGFGIMLSEAGQYAFTNGRKGYYTPAELEVIVTNIGDNPTGAMLVSIQEDNGFTLNIDTTYGARINLSSISSANGTTRFNIMPVEGLAPGRYTVTVTVSGNNIASQSFDVIFKVFSYGCKCDNTSPIDYTLLYIIPAMVGIIVLLWLGLRPLPITQEIHEANEEKKEVENLSKLLAIANNETPPDEES